MADKDESVDRQGALEAALDEQAPTDSTEGSPSDQQKAEPEPLDPPEHWDAEVRDRFRSTPREWQEWLVERDKAMTAAHTRRSQEIAPLRRVAEQWNPFFQQLGAPPDAYLNDLLMREHQLATGDPNTRAHILMQRAQQLGIPLTLPQQQQEAAPEDDPLGIGAQIAAAIGPIAQQNQQLQQAYQQQAYQQQAYQAQQAESMGQATIADFRSAKGEDGKPSHPYFDELIGEMEREAAYIVQGGGRPDIAQLYENAKWSNPTVRAKILKDQEHAAKAARDQTARDSRATGGLTGGSGGGSAQPKTRDELLAEELDKMMA